MNKTQILTLLASVLLFLGLYFGFDTKPEKQKKSDHTHAGPTESTDPGSLKSEAFATLDAGQKEQIVALEKQFEDAKEGQRVALLKKMSGLWYDFGHLPVAGEVAEVIAGIENADSSWSVAGALFFNGLLATNDPNLRQYCADHAVKSFEKASALAPDDPIHRVNLALVWAENPPPNNPMQAVLMLRELEQKYPDQPAVYNALGRLAIKTGQWQRAIERLEKARSLDPGHPNTPCLLAQAYKGAGNNEKATEFAALCNNR
jgi:hypothetical protein